MACANGHLEHLTDLLAGEDDRVWRNDQPSHQIIHFGDGMSLVSAIERLCFDEQLLFEEQPCGYIASTFA